MHLLEIDAEFQALCPPLQAEERAQLEASLLAEGCREHLSVWNDGAGLLLLDGHNRHAICTQYDIPYPVHLIDLESREDAINWIIANQLGRRNLTPEQKSYLRGKRCQTEKRQDAGHGNQKSAIENQQPIHEKLADEYHVSRSTIYADSQFATAIDTLESQVRQDIRNTILHRQAPSIERPSKEQITRAGKLVQKQEVSPQPFMRREGWKPYQVLEAIEVLGALPAEEHPALNTLLDQPFIPADDGLDMLKKVQAMASEQRQRIYQLARSPDPRDRSDAKTLAAQIPPEPDPQLLIAQHLIQALEDVRTQQRRNWRRAFPDEPWTEDLDAIDALMADIQDRWRTIAARVKTSYTERIASYAITVTA